MQSWPPTGSLEIVDIIISINIIISISINNLESRAPSADIPFFLSDPSPIIGNPCHSLTHSCLVDLVDVTVACEDANSKLIEIATVADVYDEDRVVTDLEAEVWS